MLENFVIFECAECSKLDPAYRRRHFRMMTREYYNKLDAREPCNKPTGTVTYLPPSEHKDAQQYFDHFVSRQAQGIKP